MVGTVILAAASQIEELLYYLSSCLLFGRSNCLCAISTPNYLNFIILGWRLRKCPHLGVIKGADISVQARRSAPFRGLSPTRSVVAWQQRRTMSTSVGTAANGNAAARALADEWKTGMLRPTTRCRPGGDEVLARASALLGRGGGYLV